MSKDVTYPFASQTHVEGTFAGIKLPTAPHMSNALSTGHSNMVPQKVDTLGRLHYGVFTNPRVKPCTDLVFRIEADAREVDEAVVLIRAFTEALRPVMQQRHKHMAIRLLKQKSCAYVVIRFYFNKDFKCTEHPEMRLGEPSAPYYCPVCNAMQIAGLPHIEDVSE